MSEQLSLKQKWDLLVSNLSEQFANGDEVDVEGILYLIGIQELGQISNRFKKDEKVNLMHIAICRLLEPYGYYQYDFTDQDGWPHYKLVQQLPPLKAGEQAVLLKQAIIEYFEKEGII